MTKSAEELTFLDNIHYYKEHTWAMVEGNQLKIGITDFAQDNLGNIIFVELPNAGESFDKGEEFGQAESAKTVSALYMPISGEIIDVNNQLEDAPQNVNEDPYGTGWMIIVKPNNISEVSELLTKEEYINLINQ
ncbi:glycine cleavage system H protein [Desulforamulus reducens MI-1]|uniref:Glycine cleavage system H protein n=1 Tax=Desulforamulus reducens (strain ATCC BAA-1160 / DSM 100696 / MI-1) TaxID=349161 RepID=A4J1F8_DESRM|nr:glycine cleavage system protein GcvH [Desulforamulus reducens]ABO48911.1 glycine cleavage system H protein [Desulforamulus reducens MI-1]